MGIGLMLLLILVPLILFRVSYNMINSGDVKKERTAKLILLCLGILFLIGFSICSKK
jgi:predicted permease